MAKIAIFKYLEAFCNRRRLHSALGYKSYYLALWCNATSSRVSILVVLMSPTTRSGDG